jgi:hypothetical protein
LEEIVIPYHLAIPTAITIVSLIIILIRRKYLFATRQKKLLWSSVVVFLVLYLLMVGSATYDAIYYQWLVNSFDLDKDGLFGRSELTQEAEAAVERLTNDTGRNLSFIIGLVFAFIIATVVYLAGRVILSIRRP